MDPSLLELVSRDIQGLFPSMYQYTPTHLLVVTWQDVGYHRQQYDQVNEGEISILETIGTSHEYHDVPTPRPIDCVFNSLFRIGL